MPRQTQSPCGRMGWSSVRAYSATLGARERGRVEAFDTCSQRQTTLKGWIDDHGSNWEDPEDCLGGFEPCEGA